jgi:hypothetical protein
MKKITHLLLIFLFFTFASANAKHPFVIAELYGQLGNQMFQIATAVSLAMDNNAQPLFPDLLVKTKYDIPENYKKVFSYFNTTPETFQRKFEVTLDYYEPSFRYHPIPYQSGIQIHGYFQSWKYFDHHKHFIQKLFAPPVSTFSYLKKKYRDIITDNKTVSIHIRTYSKDDPTHLTYPFNGTEFVKEAMTLFPEDSHYIVFSDDIEWCRVNLTPLAPHIRFIEGESYLNDFYLQSLCKHHIISNSSFSWWAAYLNKNENKKVVVPGQWFQPSTGLSIEDLIPTDWVILTDY